MRLQTIVTTAIICSVIGNGAIAYLAFIIA
jgi:hypothetical protein